MFENMWFIEPTSNDVVTSGWSSISNLDAVENLLCRIDRCSDELINWNQTTFGHMGQQIKEGEPQLKGQPDAISRCQTLRFIRDWRREEEILGCQQACSDYLKFEDSNTR